MRLLIQEFKKIFRPGYLAVAIAFFLFWGFLQSYESFTQLSSQAHTDSYPEDIPIDAHYSMDLLFTDALLEAYGPTIEKSELPRLREQYERLSSQIRRAAESDKILLKDGSYLSDDFMIVQTTPVLEDPTGNPTGNTPQLPDSEQEYHDRFINGQLQLPGTDAPVYFAQRLYHTLPVWENAAQNLSDHETVYTVLSTTLVSNLITCLYPIILAGLCSLFLIVPYGILENQRGTTPLLYTSKRGRKIERLRLWNIAACALLFLAVGIFFSAIMFGSWDVERYYDSSIDSVMMEIKFPGLYDDLRLASTWPFSMEIFQQSAYSGMTFLQLYIGLCAALVLAILAIVLIAGTLISHMRNIIAAFLAAVPFAILGYVFFNRYVESAIGYVTNYYLGGGNPWYSFFCRNEVWITVSVLVLAALISGIIFLHQSKKREF